MAWVPWQLCLGSSAAGSQRKRLDTGVTDLLEAGANPGTESVMDKTVVVFRVFKKSAGGGVIALFPEVDEGRGLCSSYMHVSQHGGADYRGVIADSRPAEPEEYASLRKELESPPYGYVLTIKKKYVRRRA
jgi:hypothetical protein